MWIINLHDSHKTKSSSLVYQQIVLPTKRWISFTYTYHAMGMVAFHGLNNIDSDDYYEILNMPKDATTAQVKQAYRHLARQRHPDRNPHDRERAQARFHKISEAYEILSDEVAKNLYDAGLRGAGRLRKLKTANLFRQNSTVNGKPYFVDIIDSNRSNIFSDLSNYLLPTLTDHYHRTKAPYAKEYRTWFANNIHQLHDGKTILMKAISEEKINIALAMLSTPPDFIRV